MATSATASQLASQARRLYTEELVKGMPGLVKHLLDSSRHALDKPADYQTAQRRRDLMQGLQKSARAWLGGMNEGLRHVLQYGASASQPGDLPRPGSAASVKGMALVDDDTIEREILTSRLALAIMDKASWEFTDLRSRVAMLEQRQELETHDMLRAHVLARVALDAWRGAGMTPEDWREAQLWLHEEFALLTEEAYHETNRWLVEHHVLPDIDLRPFIRRARDIGVGSSALALGPSRPAVMPSTGRPAGVAARLSDPGSEIGSGHGRGAAQAPDSGRGGVGDETRMMTRTGPLAHGSDHAEAVLGRLNRLVGRHLPGFADTTRGPVAVTPRLSRAIELAQDSLKQRLIAGADQAAAPAMTTPMLLDDLQQRKQLLKHAASTPAERATIEIVAMMFQAILTEDRIPATVRVWFARLQMPVLRVAVSEPDFFATIDHPARRLIDRMGSCVMGFDSSAQAVGDTLEKEIKRVVQVVEAYPDTGRRVFQTVLVEFEKFLEHYFRNENEATRKGVSLAQQVEQRETLAIQYTIELRRMLNEIPVQEGIRQFLFQVWADVLATTAVRYGAQTDETKAMKRAAADLIWSASAKVTREERAEVIRRLPLLLKKVRDGMAAANMSSERQEEHIQSLNNSLAAAFTAKAAVIPSDRLGELMERLETLEELLPDAADMEIDESMVLDLSGHESSELEVVAEGGSMPSPAMLSWARELLVGSWYMLDYRDHNEPVQLVWHGLRRQLSLFVAASGRCVLFQQQRLAAFLQAGLLLPAQDEALTVKATRSALAKIDADPSRLTH
ncbi:DUF1631 family protein [Aquincola sp. S2]|uniref:DUF1631 family protein n=1 Tax=Pseudaquabacterium terrae TaxID=2732868 RepID=A0ABX2EDS7_9BURK|nr:DUF1631 family protein [Aquabacterium terrae]NRF66692.1 DUF1631 family protein [Aquabacterium terrae]